MKYLTRIVSGVLILNNKVLLGLRKNTHFFSQHWAFPVGHIEEAENITDALRRELFEEIGVQMLSEQTLTTLYDNSNRIEHYVHLVTEWRGEPHNCEPEFCEKLDWFSLTDLPKPLTPTTQKVLSNLCSL